MALATVTSDLVLAIQTTELATTNAAQVPREYALLFGHEMRVSMLMRLFAQARISRVSKPRERM